MIRIERVPLPDGLRALAHRDPDGGLLIYVSSTLDAPVQRTAVLAAVRASRRSEGRTAAPLGLALLVGLRLRLGSWRGAGSALGRRVTLARHIRHIRHIRPVGWAAGSAVAASAVAAGLVLSAPAQPHPAAAPPAGGRTSQSPAGPAHGPGQARRAAGTTGTPTPAAGVLAGQPQAAQHSLAARSPAPPSSAPGSAPATATPAPSPAPATGPLGTCVIVLGIPVCVPVSASVSASVGG
jgi:hypothetical protein